MPRKIIYSIILLLIIIKESKSQQLGLEFYLKVPLYCQVEFADGKQHYTGSGFAVKRDNSYYLITNYHLITSWDYYNLIAHEPTIKRIAINITGLNKDKNPAHIRLPLYKPNGEPNFTVLKLDDKEGDLISLKILDTTTIDFKPIPYNTFNFDYKKKDSTYQCLYIGFPGCNGQPVPLAGYSYLVKFDSDAVALPNHPEFYVWIMRFASPKGFSGSPIFQFDSVNIPRLIGVLSGTNKDESTIMWPIKYIEDLMNQTPK